jgi:hypothetical protein
MHLTIDRHGPQVQRQHGPPADLSGLLSGDKGQLRIGSSRNDDLSIRHHGQIDACPVELTQLISPGIRAVDHSNRDLCSCRQLDGPAPELVPPGMSANAIREHPSMVRTLLKANPKEVGAMRIDPHSEDTDYREQMRLTFGGDISAADFAQALAHRHCDEPARPSSRNRR